MESQSSSSTSSSKSATTTTTTSTTKNNDKTLAISTSIQYNKAPVRLIPTTTYYGVQFPGIVEDPKKAIQLFGGIPQLQKTLNNTNEFLALKFKPDDPNKALFGTKVPTCNLVLRVRKRTLQQPQQQQQQQQQPSQTTTVVSDTNVNNNNNNNEQEQPTIETDKEEQQDKQQNKQSQQIIEFEGKVIAIVPTTIQFDGLCDFQYHPNAKSQSSNKGNHAYFDNEEEVEQDQTMQILPPIFSRIDYPQKYMFKQNPLATFDPNSRTFKLRTKKVSNFVTVTHINEPTPIEPNQKPPNFFNEHTFQTTFNILKTLFEQRPMWLPIPLTDYVCKQGGYHFCIKQLLPSVAYHFTNGPWRNCWVRFGYDPRIQPESKVFQIVDLRLDSYSTKEPPKHISQPSRRTHPPINLLELKKEQKLLSDKPSDKYVPPYDYTFKVHPKQNQAIYQIVDLDQKFKNFILGEETQSSCSEKYGWFTQHSIRKLVVAMKTKAGSSDIKMRYKGTGIKDQNGDEIIELEEDEDEMANLEQFQQIISGENLEQMERDMDYIDQYNENEAFKILGEETDDEYVHGDEEEEDENEIQEQDEIRKNEVLESEYYDYVAEDTYTTNDEGDTENSDDGDEE
eukprot:gene3733-4652_t